MGARLLAVLLALVATALCARAETVTLRFATTLPLNDEPGAVALSDWMKQVAADSGGAVQWQQFWDGQLIGNPTKEYDAVVNGIDDATVVITPFVQQQFPDFALFAIPFVVDSAEEAAIGGWRLYEKGMIRGLDKLHVAAVYSNDVAGIHLAKDIHTLGELKGLKIRVSGPSEGKIVELMGGVPVGMNIMEAAQALTVGTYQGTLNGWGGNHAYRFTPLLKSHIEAPLGVRIFLLALSKAAYDKLPPQGRRALDQDSGYELSRKLGKISDSEGAAERQKSIALKQTMIGVDAAQTKALETAFHPMLERWIADTPDGQDKYDTVEQTLAGYRKGR